MPQRSLEQIEQQFRQMGIDPTTTPSVPHYCRRCDTEPPAPDKLVCIELHNGTSDMQGGDNAKLA